MVNRTSIWTALAVFGSLVYLPSARAAVDWNPGDKLTLADSTGSTSGGIFVAQHYIGGTVADEYWETFCVQRDEVVTLGPTKYSADLNTANNKGKPLTSFAAWMYTNFLDRTLRGFVGLALHDQVTNTGGVPNVAPNIRRVDTVQKALWTEFGTTETFSTSTDNTNYGGLGLSAKTQKALYEQWKLDWQDDITAGKWGGGSFIGDVRVLNLWITDSKGKRVERQDQLIRIPRTLSAVPEPASVAVWSALSGLGLVLHRRRWPR